MPPRPDFRTLFERELGYVLETLRRLGVARADAEDMAHDVFVAVLKQYDAYDPTRPIKPWLFGFAFRIASQYRKKARRTEPLEEPERLMDSAARPDAAYAIARKRRMVQLALEEIELDRRAVFVMHDIDGSTGEDIARALEIPLGTVYSRLRLAREDFAAKMRRRQAGGRLE
ncbi:MAG: RNA polymerase sigma factor [Myxococcales bacterium]|nr:RNA polymerase sigma factor [Myxococcales bacterium]